MIPEAAVEAAREQLEELGMYLSPKYARATLEAAAPHMMAEAWRTGCIEGLTTDFGLEADVLASNPYRSAK